MLVLNSGGETTAYYVEKEGFVVLAGFLRLGSSSALISYDTTDFHIEGKEGSWLAYDSIIIEGREFFLMEHSVYGAQAANVVLDSEGKLCRRWRRKKKWSGEGNKKEEDALSGGQASSFFLVSEIL